MPPLPPMPPRIPRIMLPARLVPPWLFTLFPLRITLICDLSVKRPMKALPWYLSSLSVPELAGMSAPAPASTLPNSPLIIPGWTERSITVSSSPSSIPVNSACSDFFWMILSLLIILAGMFLEASWGSSRKKVLPSMVIFEMVSPLAVMEPSSETSTPGSFLSRSSSTSLSVVLNEVALYSTVSFFIITGLPMAATVAASSWVASGSNFTLPRSTVSLSTFIVVVYVL